MNVKTVSVEEVEAENVDMLFRIWLLSRSTENLVDSVLRPTGLSGDEFAIFSVLEAAPGITPGELARWMSAPATTVSSYVRRFESRGHVRREPKAEDRRSYGLTLTPTGRQAHGDARKRLRPIQEMLVSVLGEEERATRQVLMRLKQVVDEGRETVAAQPAPIVSP